MEAKLYLEDIEKLSKFLEIFKTRLCKDKEVRTLVKNAIEVIEVYKFKKRELFLVVDFSVIGSIPVIIFNEREELIKHLKKISKIESFI